MQQRNFFFAHGAIPPDDVQIAGHQGKGLALALLELAQAADGLTIAGIAGQLETAQPLYGKDITPLYQRAGGINVIDCLQRFNTDRTAFCTFQPGMRAAGVAGNRLGMKAAICRILVFGRTRGTQREDPHGGCRPVIGNRFDDRQAWAAMGAVGEGVAVTSCIRRKYFRQTRRTRCGVGYDVRVDVVSRVAGDDAEICFFRPLRAGFPLDGVDAGKWRCLDRQGVNESRDSRSGATDMDNDALPVIGHPAAQAIFVGKSPHRGPKADALHDTAHPNKLGGFGWNGFESTGNAHDDSSAQVGHPAS